MRRGEEDMAWRLYDVINDQWYNDELYDTHDACLAAGAHYMREAQLTGEVLELIVESLDPMEAEDSLLEEDERP
jgi:hypothetical protein